MVKLVGKVAFVTGCNGISGNAIVEHLIRTPKSDWYDPPHAATAVARSATDNPIGPKL